jgi:hypothetical protein
LQKGIDNIGLALVSALVSVQSRQFSNPKNERHSDMAPKKEATREQGTSISRTVQGGTVTIEIGSSGADAPAAPSISEAVQTGGSIEEATAPATKEDILPRAAPQEALEDMTALERLEYAERIIKDVLPELIEEKARIEKELARISDAIARNNPPG